MPARKKKKNSGFGTKVFIVFALILLAGAAGMGYKYYRYIYQPNVILEGAKERFVYLPTGSSFADVTRILYEGGFLRDMASFEWVAERKNYKNHILPGRYRIRHRMNNEQLVNLLRSGRQTPVKVTFNNIRFAGELAAAVAENIEAGPASILDALSDTRIPEKYGIDVAEPMHICLPNTYEFYWNTSAEQFMERMAKEYVKFWTEERRKKARDIGLSVHGVTVLASIVQQETARNDEKPVVAGAYMNRLKKNMPLQADPTLVFAAGDFTIRRVLNVHKEIDSPYNTYKHTGLPPGPICLPSAASLRGVLNYRKHNYLFFCARGDGSGYHNFAVTYQEHQVNAKRYREELNRRKMVR